MFRHYHDATMAVFDRFMVGSLNKIWPWKQVWNTALTATGSRNR
ncbi:MAG: DUF368 domain-containing protein [Haliscomenobacter sp.]|nr:DUF368 domain-containing protein [Haliscomenobacter sp.]